MGRIVAGADFGSNKTGYIVGEVSGARIDVLERASSFTRLAEGLGSERRIRGAAAARLLDWCAQMRQRFDKLGVARFRGVGTEALRRASNRRQVLELVQDVLGEPVEVVSGQEEGRITFEGVRLGYPRGPLAVIDIGGGSTEVVHAGSPPRGRDERPVAASFRMGAVILTEQHGEEWDGLCRSVRAHLHRFAPRGELPGVLTVLGGTGANLTMMDLGERDLKDDHIEGHVVERRRLEEVRKRTQAMSRRQRVTRLGLLPQRADVQVAGLAILETVLDHLAIKAVRTTRYALRHGVLRSVAAAGRRG